MSHIQITEGGVTPAKTVSKLQIDPIMLASTLNYSYDGDYSRKG